MNRPSSVVRSAEAAIPATQHNVEIEANRAAWERKPFLRQIYREFYELIARRITHPPDGPVVELGSGMGRIKEVIPECITTDLFPNPWLDRQENAYALSFPDASVSHLILFDVWHHLRYPGTALQEFRRVLVPGGRLILFEPAASWTGRFVYHFFHHEPVALRNPITWNAPAGFTAADADYYAAQGTATRVFWWGRHRESLKGWRVKEVAPIASFSYFASGGFSGPTLVGPFLNRILKVVDRAAAWFPAVFAARLLVVVEKEGP